MGGFLSYQAVRTGLQTELLDNCSDFFLNQLSLVVVGGWEAKLGRVLNRFLLEWVGGWVGG